MSKPLIRPGHCDATKSGCETYVRCGQTMCKGRRRAGSEIQGCHAEENEVNYREQ
jgi:hypothetical protein